jgi:hypothetical protein
MATVTLRPNDEMGGPATVVGTGDAADVTNDVPDDDATYFVNTAGGQWTVVAFGSSTMPTGSVVKQIQPIVRMSGSGGESRGETQLRTTLSAVLKTSPFAIPAAFDDYDVPAYVNPYLTQTDIDDLRFAVRSTFGTVHVSEIELLVVLAEQPTTNAIGPTGTETTSRPSIEWMHTPGTDGGEQAAWQVRVFSQAQYTAPNFSPETSYATWESTGNTAVSSTITGLLAHNTAYRAYVRTAQRVGGVLHWAEYDFVSFSIDLVGPSVQAITMTVDNAFARIVADIDRVAAGDAWDHVELQRLAETNLITDAASLFQGDANSDGIADSWDADTTGTVSATYSLTGGYQRIAATGVDAGDVVELQYGEPFPVAGGGSYVAGVTAKAPSLGTNTAITVGIRFFDALGNVEEDTETAFGDAAVNTTDLGYVHAAVAPDTAAYGAVTVGVYGLTGASGAAITADFVDAWMVAGAEDVVWIDVAGAEDVTPDTSTVTILDPFAPGNTPVRYRTRAVDANDNTGDWVYASGTYEWLQTDTWIKCPQRPGFSTIACLALRPEFKRKRRRGVHEILESASPRTVSGPRQLRSGPLAFETETVAEYRAVMAALEEPVVLVQFHPNYKIDQMWASLGDLDEAFPDDRGMSLAWRTIVIDVVEVSGP